MNRDYSNSSLAVQSAGGGRDHRGIRRAFRRLFPIQEMPSAYECGLLDVPIEYHHRPHRPGTEIVRHRPPSSLNDSRPTRTMTSTTTTNRRNTRDRHQPLLIPLAPGIMGRIRGVQETVQCITNDYYLPATCMCCAQNLFCIMDACFVLCPTCKVVSPLEGGADHEFDGGVGLGFTLEELQRIQWDIYTRRGRESVLF